MIESKVRDFDPTALSADFYTNPFPLYAKLQRQDPVHHCRDGSFFLTRYQDLITIYQDARRFSSDKKVAFKPKFGNGPLYEHHTTSLVFNDPPLHTRVRKILTGALTRNTVAMMEKSVRRLVLRLLDRMESRTEIDAIEDFAAMIPVEVIGNLLSIPYSERAPLRDWSLAILGALEPAISPEILAQGDRAVSDFLMYLKDLTARRRRHSGEHDDDLLGRLMQDSPNGETLSELELLHNCIFILNAGHETTTNIIGNGIHLFIEHPEYWQQIDQHAQLIEPAVEELLRFESPNQLGNRMVTQAVEIRGVKLPAGAQLTLCIGAANRDPEIYPRPQQFLPRRRPNKHLAFASGPHLCAGGHVARMEARIALQEFFQRFPKPSFAAPPERSRRARFRGFVRLPIKPA